MPNNRPHKERQVGLECIGTGTHQVRAHDLLAGQAHAGMPQLEFHYAPCSDPKARLHVAR